MKGFYISVSNGLIEDKHRVAMGEAIWLYMLLLDKMTSVSEAGVGKVLGGKPLKHHDILEFYPLMPRITYIRYVAILKEAGYVETTRTPRGLVFKILKAKKIFTGDVSNMKHQTKTDVPKTIHRKKSDVSNLDTDVSNMKHLEDVSNMKHAIKTRQSRQDKDKTSITNVIGANAPEHQKEISKLYFQVIKTLGLPVLNHNTVKTKIKALFTEDEPEVIINYLLFMRDQYKKTSWDFKPAITNALDIYSKRLSIQTTAERAAKEQAEVRTFRI